MRSVLGLFLLFGILVSGCGLLLGEPNEPSTADGGIDQADAGEGGLPGMCEGICSTSCEQRCEEGAECSCTRGCACNIDCVPGDDCFVYCREPGTRCEVDARETSNLTLYCKYEGFCAFDARFVSNADVHCEDAACEVDCRGSSNCFVRCSAGAACALRCRDTSNCGFSFCDGEITACDGEGDLSVCNRPCP